jgi:hypothetical protein
MDVTSAGLCPVMGFHVKSVERYFVVIGIVQKLLCHTFFIVDACCYILLTSSLLCHIFFTDLKRQVSY